MLVFRVVRFSCMSEATGEISIAHGRPLPEIERRLFRHGKPLPLCQNSGALVTWLQIWAHLCTKSRDQTLIITLSTQSLFSLSAGVHHRHLLCADLVRPEVKVQQHHEGAAPQQQHGGQDLDPRHLLPQLQESRRPLDHHTQPHAAHLERRTDIIHTEVRPARKKGVRWLSG